MSNTLELAATATAPASATAGVPAVAAPAVGGVGSMGFKRVARLALKILSTAMIVIAIAAFALLAVGPRLLGYQTSTMLTGSMAPLINPGDVVVTVPVPVTDLRVGDVITYHIPVEDQRVETHRITELSTTVDGRTAVQTKGDANNGKDPWVAILPGTAVDRHVMTIPHLGTVIRALREPAVRNALMYGAPAILVVGLLASIWGKDPKKQQNESGTQAVPAAHGT